LKAWKKSVTEPKIQGKKKNGLPDRLVLSLQFLGLQPSGSAAQPHKSNLIWKKSELPQKREQEMLCQ
jgi:hypothetical protein